MKKIALIIMDGYGIGKNTSCNAIKSAHTPFIDSLFKEYPTTLISASEESVGLTSGQMGNSEVGHLNIGAGRVVKQLSNKISETINDESFFDNDHIKYAIKNKNNIHIMGLLSNAGVHSMISHLYALLEMVKGKKNVYLHLFTDGRDSGVTDSHKYLRELIHKIDKKNINLASLCGRYYAMDRDNNHNLTDKVYRMLTKGECEFEFDNLIKGVSHFHKLETFDEFIPPIISKSSFKKIESNDSVIFINFRGDRARQLTSALTGKKENKYDIKIKKDKFITFGEYDKLNKFYTPAFKMNNIENTLGEVLSLKGKRQLRIAETTKYAHVTYFFNGGREDNFINEKRVLVDTGDISSIETNPQMSAKEITDYIINNTNNDFEFILLNYANCDMIGHTGNFSATVTAVEYLDFQLKRLVSHLKSENYDIVLTSDHGNAEIMIDKDGKKHTKHTLSMVPITVISQDYKNIKYISNGRLSNIAPMILSMFNIEIPIEYDNSLAVSIGIDKIKSK